MWPAGGLTPGTLFGQGLVWVAGSMSRSHQTLPRGTASSALPEQGWFGC